MATYLRIGKNIGSSGVASNTSLSTTPSDNYFYWSVYGLGSAVKNYTKFYLYDYNSISFTQGQSTQPSGTVIATYSSTTNTNTYFTSSKVTVPASYLKAGNTYSFVAIAQNSGGYWAIGGTSSTTTSFEVVYLYLADTDWFRDSFSISIVPTGQTTATATIKHKGYNSPKYINYINRCTSATSVYGSNSQSGTEKQYVALSGSTSSSQTVTMSITGLTAGSSNTMYFTAETNTLYSAYKYYGLGSKSVNTDAVYSTTNTVSVTSSSTATITSVLNSTMNLDGRIYYSTSPTLDSKPNTYVSYNSKKTGTISLSDLLSGQSHTLYLYVYSSATRSLYSAGSVSFTTDASSYTGTITSSNVTSNSALLTLSNLSNTTNLNSKWYISTTNSSTATSLSDVYSAERGATISLSNLLESTPYTFYGYVYSSASSKYYKIGEVSFSTNASTYTANVVITGITDNSAYLCMYNLSNTNNLDGKYYISSNNYGTSSSTIEPIASVQWANSYQFTNLIPGNEYVYYIYVYNTSTNTYMYVTSATFVTHSGIIYVKNEELEPYRLYVYNNEDGNWYGLSFENT